MSDRKTSRQYWSEKDSKTQPKDFVARENFKARLAARVEAALSSPGMLELSLQVEKEGLNEVKDNKWGDLDENGRPKK